MEPLAELFDISYGHGLSLNALRQTSPRAGVRFVSRKTTNNGVAAYVEKIVGLDPCQGGSLTCALNGEGSALATFLQERPYYTAFHIATLRPRHPFSESQLLYYCACLWANHYRYSWGRQANRTLKDILLPTPEEMPAWVAATVIDRLTGADAPFEIARQAVALTSPQTWHTYRIEELFDIKKGKRLTKAKMKAGDIPFIGAIDGNNGVSAFVASSLHAGNTITVNYNGSVAEAFYQPTAFWCSDDVNVLYPKFELTPAIALFIATVIRLERYRFSYGRKWHLDRMKTSSIKLPSSPSGEPDYTYMGKYIKSLPFSGQASRKVEQSCTTQSGSSAQPNDSPTF